MGLLREALIFVHKKPPGTKDQGAKSKVLTQLEEHKEAWKGDMKKG